MLYDIEEIDIIYFSELTAKSLKMNKQTFANELEDAKETLDSRMDFTKF